MMTRAPTFGSQAPAPVSQCELLPLVAGSIFTHISAFFIMKVPVRTSVPWPTFVARAAGALVIVALPSMKTVPRTVSCVRPVPLELAGSRPARVRDARRGEIDRRSPRRSRAVVQIRVGARRGVEASREDRGRQRAGRAGREGPEIRRSVRLPMLLRAVSNGAREAWIRVGEQQVSLGTKSRKSGGITLPCVVAQI